MKYIITGIIVMQLSFCCDAQDHVASMVSLLSNNSAAINDGNNLIHADTSIPSTKPVVPWFVERFKLAAGFFIPSSSTKVQVGTNDGTTGTDIDFERDLGGEKTVGTFLADLQWRASRRSRFDLSYYRVYRSTDYTLKKDIVFGDTTFKVDATVKSFFNNDIIRFSYGYAIFSKPKFELGALVGVHIAGTKAGLALNGTGGGTEVSEDFGFTAPLPDFGIWGGYAFSNRFAVNAEADYFALTIGDIKGRIVGYNILVSYRVIKNLDIALGYTGLSFKVDVVKTDLSGQFKWDYHGPNLTAAFSFGNKSWTH